MKVINSQDIKLRDGRNWASVPIDPTPSHDERSCRKACQSQNPEWGGRDWQSVILPRPMLIPMGPTRRRKKVTSIQYGQFPEACRFTAADANSRLEVSQRH